MAQENPETADLIDMNCRSIIRSLPGCGQVLRKAPAVLALLAILLGVTACGEKRSESVTLKPELMIYCGTTMAKPIRHLADTFEQDFQCKVIMVQGGSENLYQSLKLSRQGDLYFPGSESYRKNHLAEGLLSDFVYLGFNQACFLVQKGNPREITGDLSWLLERDLNVAIGNSDICAIGKYTRKILTNARIYDQVAVESLILAADSQDLNRHLKDKTVDLTINWRATAFFAENRDAIEVVDLDPSISPRKKLVMSLLTFSRQPDLARHFMAYTSSPTGQSVFREYGFLDEESSDQEQIKAVCR
jgi:molybdate transport system substrate-binding protein